MLFKHFDNTPVISILIQAFRFPSIFFVKCDDLPSLRPHETSQNSPPPSVFLMVVWLKWQEMAYMNPFSFFGDVFRIKLLRISNR